MQSNKALAVNETLSNKQLTKVKRIVRSTMLNHPSGKDYATLYRVLVEELPDYAIFLVDTEGRITSWNKGVERNLGYTEEEFIRQYTRIIFTPEDQENKVPEKERETATREGRAADVRWHKRKDGSPIFVDGVLNALHDEAGTLIGFSKVMRDITEKKEAEQKLEQANMALERSNQDLERFADATSHDLRSFLHKVIMSAQLLTRRYQKKPDPEAEELVRIITSAVREMDTLISDILTYSKVGAEQGEVKPVSVKDALFRALSSLQEVIKETNAVVTSDAMPAVLANDTQLLRLFQNLVGNAIKYRRNVTPRIHVSAKKNNAEWIIAVDDNGQGFEPKHSSQIFEPFKRLHGNEYSGSGIGLATCKRIVERYGGKIWAESEPGKGSTFYFTLPATLEC